MKDESKPLDPAAKLGVRVLLWMGLVVLIVTMFRTILRIGRVVEGDVELGLVVVLRICLSLLFVGVGLRCLIYGRRRLRATDSPPLDGGRQGGERPGG